MTDADAGGGGTRSIDLEREVAAPPEEVWAALTTPEGLRRWFPLDARVEPGEGGSVWLSWGPGAEGEGPIHVWRPPSRFGWTESHGADAEGRPVEVTVDFHVEGRGGVTVVRLVHAGFGVSEEWDELYDALLDGWTHFLFSLAYYFLRHRGRKRRLVWRRVAVDIGREALWDRLVQGALIGAAAGPGAPFDVQIAGTHTGEVISTRPGYHFTGTLPDLEHSLLFVELEGANLGIWLSTYDMGEARVAELQRFLDARVEEIVEAR